MTKFSIGRVSAVKARLQVVGNGWAVSKNGCALPDGIDGLECFGQLQDGQVSTRLTYDLQANG